MVGPTSTQNETIRDFAQAIVKVTSDPTTAQAMVAREGVDEMCEGCGMFGHNIYKSGCDRCAQYILIKRYLEKNPGNDKSIISKYKNTKKNGQKKERRRIRNSKRRNLQNLLKVKDIIPGTTKLRYRKFRTQLCQQLHRQNRSPVMTSHILVLRAATHKNETKQVQNRVTVGMQLIVKQL